jgi:hypothetical protein
MQKEELIKKTPLRILNPLSSESLPDHRMGLVMARAGLGKTAILVQIAMDSMLARRLFWCRLPWTACCGARRYCM